MTEENSADDLSIPNSDRLFRRVPPNQLSTADDGHLVPSSAVFKTTELSVNIETLMIKQGRPPEDTLANHPHHFLTSIIAGDVRKHGHPIVKDTEAREGETPPDPAHGLVLGKKKTSFGAAMVRSCVWVVAPPSEPD